MQSTESVATRLGVWRQHAGLSLRDVAALSGVSVSTLSKAERGLTELSAATKVHLARSLDVPVALLFDPPERRQSV